MFDFSFGEISLIAVVALLVLGPERLPRVARTAGALVRRARHSWQNVREEIERELQADELKRSLEEARQAATDLQQDLHGVGSEVKASLDAGTAPAETAATPAAQDPQPVLPDGAHHEQR